MTLKPQHFSNSTSAQHYSTPNKTQAPSFPFYTNQEENNGLTKEVILQCLR